MNTYLQHVKDILCSEHSYFKKNRTGVDTISLFGYQNTYDLQEGFPLLTTKKVYTRAIIHELLWFMRGDTNIKYLVDNNVRIWNEWGLRRYLKAVGKSVEMYSEEWDKELKSYIENIKNDEEFAKKYGDLGPVYGKQWRKWKTSDGEVIDQFKEVVDMIKQKSQSRRMLVSAWNPAEVKHMALPPCHTIFQFMVREDKLDLQLYQRSADMFLGVPFNIASYSLLLHVIAKQADLKPGRFIHTFSDSHIYCGAGQRGSWYNDNLQTLRIKVEKANSTDDFKAILKWVEESVPKEPKGKEGQDHITAVLEQLSRKPRKLPRVHVKKKPFEELSIDDFEIKDYNPHKPIKRNVAV